MKKILILSISLLFLISNRISAQDRTAAEKFGNTLNIGGGIGYYGYVGHPVPFGLINYEIGVARNFTLAPFLGMYSYQNYYYWGSSDITYRNYSYRETVIPVGLKGTYYFDKLFNAGPRWDFYAAGSVGFAFRNVIWENGYYGDRHLNQTASPLYLDAHIGSEYHMNSSTGLFLDLSTGVSTFGLAVHF